MEKTLISRQSLAERWDYSSTKVIETYEQQGIITRVPGLPSPRYSLEEILKIESLGKVNPLSPYERRRLEKRIEDLENENNMYKEKFSNIKGILD